MKIYGRLVAAVFLTWTWHASGLGAVWASEKACEEAVTTAEMRDCLNRRYAEVDDELNRVYKQLLSQLDPERRELLRDAQKAWIEFRDKNAAFVASDAEGGTLYPIIEVSERASMTEHRIEELKERLQ